MARTSSLGFQHVDSTGRVEVLERLRRNRIAQLTVTRSPFPTSGRSFFEALRGNESVTTLKLATPAVLDDDCFVNVGTAATAAAEAAPDNVDHPTREFYLTRLGVDLTNLQTIVFHGVWEDQHVATLLEALRPGRVYDLKFWYVGAGWSLSSLDQTQRLAHAIRRRLFHSIELPIIQLPLNLADSDILPLLQAMAFQSTTIRVPMTTTTTEALERAPMRRRRGTISAPVLKSLLESPVADRGEEDETPPRLQTLRVGTLQGGVRGISQTVDLCSLEPFCLGGGATTTAGTKFPLERIELLVSPTHVPDFGPLISFCQQTPTLTQMDVGVHHEDRRVPLSEHDPIAAASIDFELSITASGIRRMLLEDEPDASKWVIVLVTKRNNTSLVYHLIRQRPQILAK
eukprot:CAMPEP_0168730576 /NCGR_PEP_ID=MMETSP0724-20121128/6801_1 /TAXON_ID=265536 /ORGANISM="Amphiprora sp., Strain CCMP467" /LENGTH=400 /DNA_ID=CAMNT_0008777517 /DNA_START=7 /DNA_END=1206 /DNA_ORIENTATION=-